MDKVRAILNWLGHKSFEVYEDLAMEMGEDKKKCEDVLRKCGSAHPPKKCPAYGKESFSRRRGILGNSARALSITIHKAVVVMEESPGRTCMI